MPNSVNRFRGQQDPDDILPWAIDWSRWLDGDTISTSVWDVETGMVLETQSNTTTTATAVVSGGTIGETYKVRNRIVTAGGLSKDKTIYITIAEE